jgi:hypothetical protein
MGTGGLSKFRGVARMEQRPRSLADHSLWPAFNVHHLNRRPGGVALAQHGLLGLVGMRVATKSHVKCSILIKIHIKRR